MSRWVKGLDSRGENRARERGRVIASRSFEVLMVAALLDFALSWKGVAVAKA